MHSPAGYQPARDLTPEERRASNEAYIAAFNARSPAEVELSLIEMKDRWTAADRARMAELRRIIAAGE